MNDSLKILYAIEMETLGIKKAFEENIKELEETSRKKDFINKMQKLGGDTNFEIKRQKIDSKLKYIEWTMMFKGFKDDRSVVPALIQELKNIMTELEEL